MILQLGLVAFQSGLLAQTVAIPTEFPQLSAAVYSPLFSDAMTPAGNPACSLQGSGFSAGGYGEKKFLVEGLHLLAASAVYQGEGACLGLHLDYLGNPGFWLSGMQLAYGKSLNRLRLGGFFRYRSARPRGHAAAGTLDYGLGVIWRTPGQGYFAFQLVNPHSWPRRNPSAESGIAACKLGFGAELSGQLYLGAEILKMNKLPPWITLTLLYRFSGTGCLRAGVAGNGPQPFLGISWDYGRFRAGLMMMYHSVMGISPGTSWFWNVPPHPAARAE